MPAPLDRSCLLSLFPCSGGDSHGQSGGRSSCCPSSSSPFGTRRAFPTLFSLTPSCPRLRVWALPGCGRRGAARPRLGPGHACGPGAGTPAARTLTKSRAGHAVQTLQKAVLLSQAISFWWSSTAASAAPNSARSVVIDL